MEKREKFSSRLGFILISAGCAIGLGNVWRFPYITGEYGGGAFVLMYLFFLLILGLPIVVMEFSVGRGSQKSSAMSFIKLHHCVGRYVKDVVKSKCVILFIRQTKAPRRPYCTVEVQNGEVVQARVENNHTPPPEVQKFIETWKQQVLYAPAQAA